MFYDPQERTATTETMALREPTVSTDRMLRLDNNHLLRTSASIAHQDL
jgi:hypothetical protein